ncbi:GNAT family N-acetyltransferase [Vibrio sp. ZSDZ65]|uniref:GNAT family N-acetyltransferase n=1 Tax=Vibrio qingdaonensis TaxID=2829491 RepID=A0A9X3CLX9_9VIBR|nr:GNAT family N-acetyltransferase [Vibrio qingdaonensis]MCW8345857.1 GNAT family N-acetyltransferase [Vibrio qingdaonensis]
MKGFHIRVMAKDELDVAVAWAAEEGWNPGLNDAANYYLADPTGFLVGVLDGEPIACISVVKYNNRFGFLGFYIVKPKYRGLGYGWKIWQRGMAYLDGCNIGLDGVVEQQDNYQHSGFVFSHNNVRYESVTRRCDLKLDEVIAANQVDESTLTRYVEGFFPAARAAFYRAWFTQPDSVALVYYDGSDIKGVGVIRACHNGYKIAPLFADNVAIANQLYPSLISAVNEGMPVYLDVPENNKAAIELAQQYQMTPSFETARMYTKSSPDIQLGRTYGVTSFEIG